MLSLRVEGKTMNPARVPVSVLLYLYKVELLNLSREKIMTAVSSLRNRQIHILTLLRLDRVM